MRAACSGQGSSITLQLEHHIRGSSMSSVSKHATGNNGTDLIAETSGKQGTKQTL